MKCSICSQTIGETFLHKPIGTYVKNAKGKKAIVCNQCQKKLPTKKEMLDHLS